MKDDGQLTIDSGQLTVSREPERMCVACRGRGGKETFVRLVCGKCGTVRLDLAGKLPGRGAYIHREASCLKAAIKKNSLTRALRCAVPPEIYDLLESEIKNNDKQRS